VTTYIGLLRAVNLAGRNAVSMAELRQLLVTLGMRDVRSLLQSGNMVFRGRMSTPAELEGRLEDETRRHLGVETGIFVRTPKEWSAVVADNPFPDQAKRDPSHLVVMFLKDTPGRPDVRALRQAIVGREAVAAKGRHAYIVYPDGIGRSRLTSAVVEKHLKTRGTARNWNTVLKIGAAAEAVELLPASDALRRR
jgi:uncharacterized protein (DUF1697 family)